MLGGSDFSFTIYLLASFIVFTGNQIDSKTGRVEMPPTVGDAVFTIVVNPKPPEERVDILSIQSKLPRDLLSKVVKFYTELEVLVSDNPDLFEPAADGPKVVPLPEAS